MGQYIDNNFAMAGALGRCGKGDVSLHEQFILSRLEYTALGKNIGYFKSDRYKGIFPSSIASVLSK